MTSTLDALSPGRQGSYVAKSCHEYLSKENMPVRYPRVLKAEPSSFTKSITDSGKAFEVKIMQRLLDEAHTPETVYHISPNASTYRREEETFHALTSPTTTVILHPRIGERFEHLWSKTSGSAFDISRVSEPDLLVKTDGIWYPVDVKDHGTSEGKTKPRTFTTSTLVDAPTWVADGVALVGNLRLDDWVQLAHYWTHMVNVGIIPPNTPSFGAIIGREEQLVWNSLDDKRWLRLNPNTGTRTKQGALEIYAAAFATALNIVTSAKAADISSELKPITHPEWKSDCPTCPWKPVCVEEMETNYAGGHITLLPGVTPDVAKPHYTAGVISVKDLASLDVPTAQHIEDTGFINGGDLVTGKYVGSGVKGLVSAIYQARVTYLGKPARNVGISAVSLRRADIEVDFDFEAQTSGVGEMLVYMWGVCTTHRTLSQDGSDTTQGTFVTFDDYRNNNDAELAAFTQTWAYFQDLINTANTTGQSLRFYHFAPVERVQMIRIAAKYAGLPGVPLREDVEAFFNSSYVIDLLPVLKSEVVWPTRSHSLKPLAKFVGFSWDEKTAGGDESLVWYQNIIEAADESTRMEWLTRLRQYNEDDTKAQLAIREWLTTHGTPSKPGSLLPSVTDLLPPK